MDSTTANSSLATTLIPTNSSQRVISTSGPAEAASDNIQTILEYHPVLLAIYSVVLLSGTISLSLMMHIMKSGTASVTSMAVLNLIFAHFVFLFTVPFRLYYYATNQWSLGHGWCKVVSSMIHIHMYMAFILYVIILITRLMAFYRKSDREASFRKIHALALSALLWTVVIVLVPCVIHFSYGNTEEKSPGDSHGTNNGTKHCFKFGRSIMSGAKVLNYITSGVVIVVATVLTALQANVLRLLYRKHRQGCTSQQDFGAQLNSLVFALIMVVCFVPYHIFRLNYLEHLDLQNVNEVFLSLTTLNCLDMLTFLGRRTCYMCLQGKTI